MKLPLEFERNMRNLLGKDFDNYIESLNEQPKKGMRVNANYITSRTLIRSQTLMRERLWD